VILLVGKVSDACLHAVRDALWRRARRAEIVASPFARPGRASWFFPAGPDVRITLRPGTGAVALDGVLCRGIGESAMPSAEAPGWTVADLAYARAEADAALLAWLSAVECTVVDRLPAWLWYNTRPALLGWSAALASCGLPPLDSVTTTDLTCVAELLCGPGVAWMPFAGGGNRYAAGKAALPGLTKTARLAPLHLTHLHDGAWRACVLGARHVVWDDSVPLPARELDPLLLCFAGRVGLNCLELVVTKCPSSVRTVNVTARPHFEAFGPAAQAEIATGLAALFVDAG
jgi:hypothetical protein